LNAWKIILTKGNWVVIFHRSLYRAESTSVFLTQACDKEVV